MTPPGAPRHVLVVDDDPDLRDLIADVLRSEGVDVSVARDGCEALDHLTSKGLRPSLILLDLMMPRMDGWQLLERLRRDPSLASIPVCIVSASCSSTPAGARTALRKPFDIESLIAVVARYAA